MNPAYAPGGVVAMRWQGVGAFSTLPGMLAHVASAYANSAALSWREAGYWRRMSTEEFAGQVRRFCLGLHELGLRKGDCVGILA
ncbi:MAG: hypothetical protein H0W72_13475, partial [Planctomycetes bacterium]|nr:hypothetical protein [Planctomycetota bacterium]